MVNPTQPPRSLTRFAHTLAVPPVPPVPPQQIVSLQRTQHDAISSLRIYAKLDDVMDLLAKEMCVPGCPLFHCSLFILYSLYTTVHCYTYPSACTSTVLWVSCDDVTHPPCTLLICTRCYMHTAFSYTAFSSCSYTRINEVSVFSSPFTQVAVGSPRWVALHTGHPRHGGRLRGLLHQGRYTYGKRPKNGLSLKNRPFTKLKMRHVN